MRTAMCVQLLKKGKMKLTKNETEKKRAANMKS